MAAEKKFEEQIKKYLKDNGIYRLGTPKQDMKNKNIGYYEKRFANAYTGSGLPDLHIVIKGISIEVEIKAENGRASELQKIKLKQIVESNSIGFVLYPKDFELFKELIQEIIVEQYDCRAFERSDRFGKKV